VFGKTTKYESFVRQLNTYQFGKDKTTSDQDTDVYVHKDDKFHRNDPCLLVGIKAKRKEQGDNVAARKEMRIKQGTPALLESIENEIIGLKHNEMAEQKNTGQKIFFGISHVSNRVEVISNRIEVIEKLLQKEIVGHKSDDPPAKKQKCGNPNEVVMTGDASHCSTLPCFKYVDTSRPILPDDFSVDISFSCSDFDWQEVQCSTDPDDKDKSVMVRLLRRIELNQLRMEQKMNQMDQKMDQKMNQMDQKLDQQMNRMNQKIDFLIRHLTSDSNK